MFDIKKNKFAVATTATFAIAVGGLWWHHDPLRGIKHYAVSDQTIYYKTTEPLFYGPRRERTIFAEGISMDQVLAQMKSNYSDADGWQYETESMPAAFLATRTVVGERVPESIRAFQNGDGRVEIKELREVAPFEASVVKHLEGAAAFLVYPGAPTYRPMGRVSTGSDLGNRLLVAN